LGCIFISAKNLANLKSRTYAYGRYGPDKLFFDFHEKYKNNNSTVRVADTSTSLAMVEFTKEFLHEITCKYVGWVYGCHCP